MDIVIISGTDMQMLMVNKCVNLNNSADLQKLFFSFLSFIECSNPFNSIQPIIMVSNIVFFNQYTSITKILITYIYIYIYILWDFYERNTHKMVLKNKIISKPICNGMIILWRVSIYVKEVLVMYWLLS